MKSLTLIFAIITGIFTPMVLPQILKADFLIHWLLILILFFSFSKIDLNKIRFIRLHFILLGFNIGLAYFSYLTLVFFKLPEFALMAFMVAIAPTATAAPAVISQFKKKVELIIPSVLISNLLIALILALTLPAMAATYATNVHFELATILTSVSITIFSPLVAVILLQKASNLSRKILQQAQNLSFLSFYLWGIAIFLVCARASYFISSTKLSLLQLIAPALIALIFAMVQYSLGYFIGKKSNDVHGKSAKSNLAYEASHILGQKNTVFIIWVCLEWFSPYIALASVFYVIWQNIFISFRIHKIKALESKTNSKDLA